MSEVAPVPEHLGTLTPSLNLHDARTAVDFYTRAFGAEVLFAMDSPDGSGKIMHGEMKIGDSVFMFCDEDPDWAALSPISVGGCPLSLNLYFPDCDAVHATALEAGATEDRAPTTYPWGERSSMITDPSGYRWAICTHVEDVTEEELVKRLETWDPS